MTMSVNHPLPRSFRRQLQGKAPILCLNCGAFVRWGEQGESHLTDQSHDATRWFCKRTCLYVYSEKTGHEVRLPETDKSRDLDWMLEAMR